MLQRPPLLVAATVLLCTALLLRAQQHCEEGEVRLSDGPSNLSGRVELCLYGVWGTVCDDFWNDADATVVCRQLNHSELGARAAPGRYFPPAESGSIHIDDVRCVGNEENLTECSYIENHNCLHFEDAGVICEEKGFTCTDGDVRLSGGDTPYEGLVEYCLDNAFGVVCDDTLWDDADANVVCNQLNYTGDANNAAIAISGGSFGFGVGVITLTGVSCRGDEEALIDCPITPFFLSLFCRGSLAAGVLCPPPNRTCENGDARLVNGRLPSEGRVEVCYNNHWGTVCHDGWGEEDAEVVCRNMGYEAEGAFPIVFGDFGLGDGLILLANVNCTGVENNLAQCPHAGVAQFFCTHREDAGVVCSDPDNACEEGDIRLVDGHTDNEGRLEICFYGHWGTVCDDQFDNLDATVACRQLGYAGEGALALPFGHFGPGVGRIFYDDTECLGNETRLEQCSTVGEIGDSNCFHREDVSLLCPSGDESVCINGEIRLVGGIGNNTGRVEICFNNVWGTVCDDSWDDADAAVVCNELGYGPEGAVGVRSAYFGPGEGPIFLDDVDCSVENHSRLYECLIDSEVGDHNCLHIEDASVICACDGCNCTNGEVRLVDGADELEGRVEICLDGVWGTICSNFWTFQDAAVTCNSAGLGATDAVPFVDGEFGPGEGPIHLDQVGCSGDEDLLLNCHHISVDFGTCSHQQDAGVRCSSQTCTEGQIRLEDGDYPSEGRVEICFDRQYYGVCDNTFDQAAAAVVCRQLEYADGEGAIAIPSAFFGFPDSFIGIDNVRCTGNESELLECGFDTPGFFCSRFRSVSVLCRGNDLNCTDGELRLADGPDLNVGRVEVCFNGRWSTVCAELWSRSDALTTCSYLGYDSPYAVALPGGTFRAGEGPVLLGDNVECSGVEESILDCLTGAPSVQACRFNDRGAGVMCPVTDTVFPCENGEVRLAGGGSQYEGRVEVCINGEWGTVCSSSWDTNDAAVVCGQLFSIAENATVQSFGAGSGLIYMSDVQCRGDERGLFDCQSFSAGGCNHFQDAGVICKKPACVEGDLRLVNGQLRSEGTVQICLNEAWGTVCDDLWGNEDAEVVCGQLGYKRTGAIALRGAHYGSGNGSILLDDVLCIGNESSLLQCPHRSPPGFCFHFEDAGVICPLPSDALGECMTGEMRLVAGTSDYNGRVEVCFHGRWGTVCDDDWDNLDARVVCNNMGYLSDDMDIAYAAGGYLFGGGNDLIFLDNVACTGTESTLTQCPSVDPGQHNCGTSENAGVFCPDPSANCSSGEMRLVGGESEREGRVEVCVGGIWSSVCADIFWDDRDAQIVCQSLNYSSENAVAVGGSVFGGGEGRILVTGLLCNGTSEESLLDCPHIHTSQFIHFFLCAGHSNDAAVVCETPGNVCEDYAVRLMDGAVPNEGRVEMCINNHWGTVCDDFWDNNEASVVCRQLNYTAEGALAISRSFFGNGFGRIHLDDLFCVGTEERLIDCGHDGEGNHNCLHIEDAGVICSVPEPACEQGDLRILHSSPGVEQLFGTLEVCFGGNWGTICDDFWDNTDASVACGQLNYSPLGAIAHSRARYGPGTGPIFLDDLHCVGNETRIVDCPGSAPATHNCAHTEDAGVMCRPTPCESGSFRLENGYSPRNGRLEVCVNEIWGTVCGRDFTDKMVGTVCSSLGYSKQGAFRAAEGLFVQSLTDRVIYSLTACQPDRDCTFNATLTDTCTHDNDLGVFCREETFSVCPTGRMRLAGGPGEREGRVEVCVGDRWGTVCDDSWDERGANLLCRSLFNESGYGETVDVAQYGDAAGTPILLDDVKCTGSESNLLSCPQLPLNSTHNCVHSEDVAVTCSSARLCRDGDIMLVYGDLPSQGTIQICLNGAWGTVCDDLFDYNDARVVCRSLGFSNGSAIPLRIAHFGQGTGDILLDNLGCTGEETSLLDCPSSPHNCQHSEDAGVICPAPQDADTNCTNGELVLVEGNSDFEGRVEMCLHGQWGTVCDDFWDHRDAQVVCNQLGMGEGYAYAVTNAGFGRGDGLIFLDNVHCRGNEERLIECPSEVPGNHNCASFEDAGVYCNNPTATCANGQLRLAGNTTIYAGRVEMCIGGEWGTICGDSSWDDTDASVVCRQLGFSGDFAVGVGGPAAFGQGDGRILLQIVQCNGSESQLIQCPSSTPGIFSFRCSSHTYDASVVCQDPDFTCTENAVRLQGGTTPNEGRVEICVGDHWGTLCDNGWDTNDAKVVCRSLNFSTEGVVAGTAGLFGEGLGRVHYDNLNCTGNEAGLHECQKSTLEEASCYYYESDVGIICPSPNPVCTHGDLRLRNGSTALEGRVEVCIGGTWGTVCDDFWDTPDASVVCRQLGHSSLSAATARFLVGSEEVPIFLDDLRCSGNEARLIDCPARDAGGHNCRHFEDAGVICQPLPCRDGQTRLVDGFSKWNGRLEICVNEVWGTVCGKGLTQADASQACMLTNLPRQGAIIGSPGFFGEGTGSIYISDSLSSPAPIPAARDCTPADAAVVFCQEEVTTECATGEVRLAGSPPNSTEGRVEVCLNNQWGTVCDDSWHVVASTITCQQLELYGGERVGAADYGDAAETPILLDDVKCTGSESNLLSCPQMPAGMEHNCMHSEDVAVRCIDTAECTEGDVRLVDGGVPSEGRVELCRWGRWGSVCADASWNDLAAQVICRQTQFQGGVAMGDSFFGQGSGEIVFNQLVCLAGAPDVSQCQFGTISSEQCSSHNNDAGVTCTDTAMTCVEGDIRFSGGANEYGGRVELCSSNQWNSLCADMWDDTEALVVCRQLNLPTEGARVTPPGFYGDGNLGQGTSGTLNCQREDLRLDSCDTDEEDQTCDSSAAGVICQAPTSEVECTDGEVQLVEGVKEGEGRLQVCLGGLWGSVCDGDGVWGEQEASVVCQQLGFSGEGATVSMEVYLGVGSGPVFLDKTSCTGGEAGLLDCDSVAANVRCRGHQMDVGLSCQVKQCADGEVRLADGGSPNAGRVEVCYGLEWGTVCSIEVDQSLADSICSTLTTTGKGAVLTGGGFFGEGSGTIYASVDGTTAAATCTHRDDVGVVCPTPGTGGGACSDGAVRLQDTDGDDSSGEGRVEVCLGGAWGSVCSDSWDNDDATVVCRQLGLDYKEAFAEVVGGGSGDILLNNVKCIGEEPHILSCEQSPLDAVKHCTHDDDAGVVCTDEKQKESSSRSGNDNSASIAVPIVLIIILIIVIIVAIVLAVLYLRQRKTGKTIFTARSQPDQLPFVDTISTSENMSEPEKTDML